MTGGSRQFSQIAAVLIRAYLRPALFSLFQVCGTQTGRNNYILSAESVANFADGVGGCASMNYLVAIRAQGYEVANRINFVLALSCRQRDYVMNVDQISADRAVLFFKTHAARLAAQTVVGET